MVKRIYEVVVIKRGSGEEIRGLIADDGLQSMWAVGVGGEVRYVSVLDEFKSKVEVKL